MTVASAFFMEGLDATVITTCLPQIAAGFGVHVSAISSAITAYLVSIAVFIPLSSWLADRFEIRRVYCAAIVAFALGSMICAFSSGP
ncbi:MAG TPA: MFS transporter, partial [Steroidobacteraceae bacterium]|nr:MFS transporter [Steroidobacteraceae bacterium]